MSFFGLELDHFIETGFAPEYLNYLKDHNTLKALFPELYSCIGIKGGPQHGEDVYEHLIGSLQYSIDQKYKQELRWACLLHDIGKVESYREMDGAVHFHRHELTGAKIAYSLIKKWNLDYKLGEYVSWAVRHHMFFFGDQASDKAYRDWLFKVGRDWGDLFKLRAADRAGNKAKAGKDCWSRNMIQQSSHLWSIENAGPCYKEDLHLSNGLKLTDEQYTNLLGLVREDSSRNTEEWLGDYIARVY